jgi:hypothetical protein
MAFHFEKPSGFNFKAGQFVDVTLTDPPETDAEGNTRTFSIASPPFEDQLVFTTRMRYTRIRPSQPCSSQGASELLPFSASCGKRIKTASRTSCIFSIPIGSSKTQLCWRERACG